MLSVNSYAQTLSLIGKPYLANRHGNQVLMLSPSQGYNETAGIFNLAVQ
jgi:hypothetical protein